MIGNSTLHVLEQDEKHFIIDKLIKSHKSYVKNGSLEINTGLQVYN